MYLCYLFIYPGRWLCRKDTLRVRKDSLQYSYVTYCCQCDVDEGSIFPLVRNACFKEHQKLTPRLILRETGIFFFKYIMMHHTHHAHPLERRGIT